MNDVHDPISEEFRETMQFIAGRLDATFNPDLKGDARKVAFVLLTANFGELTGQGRVNYISNGKREDIVAMMKELIDRFEGPGDGLSS